MFFWIHLLLGYFVWGCFILFFDYCEMRDSIVLPQHVIPGIKWDVSIALWAGPKLLVNMQRQKNLITRNHSMETEVLRGRVWLCLLIIRALPLSSSIVLAALSCLLLVLFPHVALLVRSSWHVLSMIRICAPWWANRFAKEYKPISFCHAPSTLDRMTSCLAGTKMAVLLRLRNCVRTFLSRVGSFWIRPEFYR